MLMHHAISTFVIIIMPLIAIISVFNVIAANMYIYNLFSFAVSSVGYHTLCHPVLLSFRYFVCCQIDVISQNVTTSIISSSHAKMFYFSTTFCGHQPKRKEKGKLNASGQTSLSYS